ncbi:hypothetical protein RvY_11927 [Ramazzottius varieornatus]|uniref:Uncharacterized protein n=1 Tax=Ramazzottius varieornatus TaxID=947166 RepID=A0A1D1VK53_RAMVA|nr:hypothetical protein RvY_11927 [Ramazzottius varieornatus]
MPTLYVSETGDDVYRPSKSKKFTLHPVEYRTPLSKKEFEEELKYTGPLRMCFLTYGGSGRRPCLLDTFKDTFKYLEFKSSAGPTITSSSSQQNQSGNYGGPYGGFDSQSHQYEPSGMGGGSYGQSSSYGQGSSGYGQGSSSYGQQSGRPQDSDRFGGSSSFGGQPSGQYGGHSQGGYGGQQGGYGGSNGQSYGPYGSSSNQQSSMESNRGMDGSYGFSLDSGRQGGMGMPDFVGGSDR